MRRMSISTRSIRITIGASDHRNDPELAASSHIFTVPLKYPAAFHSSNFGIELVGRRDFRSDLGLDRRVGQLFGKERMRHRIGQQAFGFLTVGIYDDLTYTFLLDNRLEFRITYRTRHRRVVEIIYAAEKQENQRIHPPEIECKRFLLAARHIGIIGHNG